MNPFDELELDPRLDPEALTEALRRRAEKAAPEDRQRIQELWRTLTVNERERVRWAFWAHPRPSDSDPRSIEALREKVPPFISRQKIPAPEPKVADAIVFEPSEPGAHELKPPTLFEGE